MEWYCFWLCIVLNWKCGGGVWGGARVYWSRMWLTTESLGNEIEMYVKHVFVFICNLFVFVWSIYYFLLCSLFFLFCFIFLLVWVLQVRAKNVMLFFYCFYFFFKLVVVLGCCVWTGFARIRLLWLYLLMSKDITIEYGMVYKACIV